MKGLIKSYIDKLTINDLKDFSLKNNINLTDSEFEYLLNLVQNNFEDIMKNEDKYLNLVEKNINSEEFIKVKKLFLYYKNRYKGYLF